jgi:hypothetical protein
MRDENQDDIRRRRASAMGVCRHFTRVSSSRVTSRARRYTAGRRQRASIDVKLTRSFIGRFARKFPVDAQLLAVTRGHTRSHASSSLFCRAVPGRWYAAAFVLSIASSNVSSPRCVVRSCFRQFTSFWTTLWIEFIAHVITVLNFWAETHACSFIPVARMVSSKCKVGTTRAILSGRPSSASGDSSWSKHKSPLAISCRASSSVLITSSPSFSLLSESESSHESRS